MASKGDGVGLYLNHDGYLRISRRGALRGKMAHRAYVERQLGRPLRDDEEIHHLCKNRACWPPTDFHLCIMPAALHAAVDIHREGGRMNGRHRRGNKRRGKK